MSEPGASEPRGETSGDEPASGGAPAEPSRHLAVTLAQATTGAWSGNSGDSGDSGDSGGSGGSGVSGGHRDSGVSGVSGGHRDSGVSGVSGGHRDDEHGDGGSGEGLDGEPGARDDDGDADYFDDLDERRDWAWVEEWRESGEPPAWAPGLTLTVFTALVVGLAVLVLSDGLADIPWLAVAANVLIAAGLTPALWLSRRLPVLRWISAGAAAGVLIGWIAALIS